MRGSDFEQGNEKVKKTIYCSDASLGFLFAADVKTKATTMFSRTTMFPLKPIIR